MGRDVSKLKGKGGGKFKYMAEKDMLELGAKFAPYRYARPLFLVHGCPVQVGRHAYVEFRSLFMWYMWRIEDVDVAVLGG